MDEIEKLKRQHVVTAFLSCHGKILIMRRSTRVGSYQGRWSGVSGYLEDPTPLAQALREIREETGLSDEDVTLRRVGVPLTVPAPELRTLWVVHPFLFEINDPRAIRLDWENTELRWVTPKQLEEYATVPRLTDALQNCLQTEDNPK